jgi:virginiamycin B lyase
MCGPTFGNRTTLASAKAETRRATTGGTATEFPLPTPDSAPRNITRGMGQTLWFTEYEGHRIAKITTSGVITEYTIPTSSSGPLGITMGPDRAIWFTESAASKIGRFGP